MATSPRRIPEPSWRLNATERRRHRAPPPSAAAAPHRGPPPAGIDDALRRRERHADPQAMDIVVVGQGILGESRGRSVVIQGSRATGQVCRCSANTRAATFDGQCPHVIVDVKVVGRTSVPARSRTDRVKPMPARSSAALKARGEVGRGGRGSCRRRSAFLPASSVLEMGRTPAKSGPPARSPPRRSRGPRGGSHTTATSRQGPQALVQDGVRRPAPGSRSPGARPSPPRTAGLLGGIGDESRGVLQELGILGCGRCRNIAR